MKFSEKLQKLRKENKLSQEQLADQLDVSRQAVSKWESGQTYPEMDKLLSLCKIFKCSLDELTNDDIKEILDSSKSQSSISNVINEILDVLSRSVLIFENMTVKNRVKVIIKLMILILILCCFQIPVDYIHYLGEEIFMSFGETIGNVLCPIWNFVLYISFLIFMFVCFYYLYKKLFLERLENMQEKEENHEDGVDEIFDEKKESIKVNSGVREEKTNTYRKKEMRRNESKSEISVSSGILKVLISIGTLFIKSCLLCFLIPFLFFFVLLIVFSIIDIYLILFEKVYFFGILPIIISGIILSYLTIKILFNVITNRKNKVVSIFRIFIISLIILGIGTGISVLEFSTVEFNSQVPKDIKERCTVKTIEKEVPMSDNLYFSIHGNYDEVTYIEDEGKKDTVVFEVNYYENFQDVFIKLCEEKDLRILQTNYFNSSNASIRKLILDSLRSKKIYDYNLFQTMNIFVITSSENIEKLKASNERVIQEERERWENSYENEISEYEDLLDQKEEEIDNLNTKISDQEMEIENYKEQIDEYKEDLKNYKEEIKNQIQGIISE